MKKGFPKSFLGIPIGWKKRGFTGSTYYVDGVENIIIHSFCNERVKIGIEDGNFFRYCPKCLCVLSNSDKENTKNDR